LEHMGGPHDSSDNPDNPKTLDPELNVTPRILLMFRAEIPYTSA